MLKMDFNNKKIIIVGQGIAGTMFSWFLHKAGKEFIVVDSGTQNSPSQTAAGLINPVTGRRVVTVWLDDIIIPFAEKTYTELGDFLDITAIKKTSIVDFFPNPFMKDSFQKKINQGASYINLVMDEQYLKECFNYEFGAGIIHPAYMVQLQTIIPHWHHFLLSSKKIINTVFDFTKLVIRPDKIVYGDIEADLIIFCDGVQGFQNPYFSLLPFALNKGEALIIEAKDIPDNLIYKKSMAIVPFKEKGIFWVGSNYIWDFEDAHPTETFKQFTKQTLQSWLKVPYKILDHKAAIRPATVERRPFIGFHPIHKNVGILNGLGTKGCSLAPYFADQLVQYIFYKTPLEKEADVTRYANILSKTALNK